jgi:hypothetical protein
MVNGFHVFLEVSESKRSKNFLFLRDERIKALSDLTMQADERIKALSDFTMQARAVPQYPSRMWRSLSLQNPCNRRK